MTPATPLQTRARRSKFSNQTLLITVGAEKVPFHVHVGLLEETSFFDVHGRLPGLERTPITSPERDQTLSPAPNYIPVKREEGTRDDYGTGKQAVDQPVDTAPLPTYLLEGSVYTAAAFGIVVDALYNIAPPAPDSRAECRTVLRSYVLALTYHIVPLQDAIVDCFRQHHQQFNVVFEDLTWLINRIGDGEEIHSIPMVRYLIDQCAWEIYSQGYNSFVQHNVFFERFLSFGDHPVRRALFEAIAQVSRTPIDPAAGLNRYTVNACIVREPAAVHMPEVIELDD
ncbi:hypothetical protein ABEF93_002262 [Exophiala dermatitidis]